MNAVNKITLLGNMAKLAKYRAEKDGVLPRAEMKVATHTFHKTKAGKWKSKTEYHNVVAFGFVANHATHALAGDLLLVEGVVDYPKGEAVIMANELRILKTRKGA